MKKTVRNLKNSGFAFYATRLVLLIGFVFFTFSSVKSQTTTKSETTVKAQNSANPQSVAKSQKELIANDKQMILGLQAGATDQKPQITEKYGRMPIGNRSIPDKKWQKGGIYEKFNPSQEVLDKRTRVAKHFDNGDGSYAAIIGDVQHYMDENGAWQDIDFTIRENNSGAYNNYGYANLTHEIKTYYPVVSDGSGIIMQYENNLFNVWKNPQLKILNTDNEVISTVNSTASNGIPNDESIKYNNYPGITDEFVVHESGIENNIIINSLQGSLLTSNVGGKAAFVQFIPLQARHIVYNNNEGVSLDFETESFMIKAQDDTIGLNFAPIVIIDNGTTMMRAFRLISLPDDKLTAEELAERDAHVTTGKYSVHFVPGGIEVYATVSLDWLQNSGRSFPITIDPNLTFGSGMANYDYPWFMKYGYTRSASIYLASEIGNIGSVTIKNVGWYVNSGDATASPSILRLKTSSTTVWSYPAITWASAIASSSTVETGNYYWPNTGWQVMLLDTVFPYTYSTAANLQVLTECNYGGTGANGSPYFRYTTYSKCRHQWWWQDNTPPTSYGTFGYNRPNLYITYTPGTTMCGNWQGNDIVPTTVWQNKTCSAGMKPFFAFSASAGTTYNFSTCDTYDGVEDTWIGIYNSTGTQVAAADDFGPYCTSSLAASTDWTCPANGTYFIVVSHYNCADLENTGYLKYKYAGVPANDACANATPLPCGTTNLAGSTISCVSETPGTGCTVSPYGVWYKFTGDGIETTISSTGNFDHEMDIVSGSCGSFTSIACVDTYTSGGTETYTFTPTYGTIYYVYIAHYSSSSTTTGTFTISRTCATSPCSNITAISGCGSSYSKTFTGGGSGIWNTGLFDYNSCGFDSPGSEKIYSFVAPTTGYYSLQVTAASGYVDYQWQASSCGETGWTCIDDIYTPGTYGYMYWTQGVTYYILLDDENSTTGTHTFYVNCPVIPPNDLCANAITLPCGTTNLAGTTVNCASETSGTGCLMASYGVWYKFTGDGIETTISSTATFDHQMAIVSGSCGNFTNVACVDDHFFASTESYTFIPASGINYYIYIAHWSSLSSITGTFTISRTCANSPCSNATAISGCGSGYPQTYTGGGAGVWNTSNDTTSCGYDCPGIEKIYSFVAPTTGTYSLEVTAASGYVDYQWQASSCGATGWTCIDDIYTTGTYGSMSWTQGVTYYILLDDENSTTGTHTFYINCPAGCVSPANETCAGATSVPTTPYTSSGTLGCNDDCSGHGYFDVFYTFTPSVNGSYTADMGLSAGDNYMRIYSGSCCTGTLVAEDDDTYGDLDPSITLNLIGGTTYYFECGSYYSTGYEGSAYNFNLVRNCTAPANETCAGATSITYSQISVGYNTSGTLGCTDDCTGRGYNDVFFSYNCTTTGSYTFDMRNSDGNTYMRIFSGSCCGTVLASDDNSYGGEDPMITLTLTAGTSYWIECGSYSSGDFMKNSAYNFYASTTAGSGHAIIGKTRYLAKANAGYPAYALPTYTPAKYNIDKVIVILKSYPTGVELIRDTSDASGVYQFSNVPDGTYRLSYDKYTVDTMQSGNDVNAIDVALMKYLLSVDTLVDPSKSFTAKHKKAANVDNNITIDVVDVARIKAKIGWPDNPVRNFPKGNWVALDTLITVAGADLNITLQTVGYGDYDASSSRYKDSLTTWGLTKSLHDKNIINRSDESITINNDGYFEVPLRISTKMNEFSALGLELSYPGTKYKLVSASMPKTANKNGLIKINPALEDIIADDNDLLVTEADGIIRVVYATTNHFDVAANDELIRLGFHSLSDADRGELDFNLSGTGLIANQYGEINGEAYLSMPRIFVQGNDTEAGFDFAGYPNPFSGDATLTYTIPENGTVKLKVYNAIGELVNELVNESQISGKHSAVFSPNGLSAGMYTFKLEFTGTEKSKCMVLKMIH
ncbi:MAG TPA: T9SS type A sorting domain-containing protein [Bacteroidales bacterium]|nr:T9SS type A sorting domain-containing protein [Bacteroidales bacterium]